MRPPLAILLLVGFALAAPVPKALKKQDDATLLVGTWKATNPGEFTHTHTFEADGHLRQLFGTDGVSDWDWVIHPDESAKRLTMVSRKATRDAWHAVCELDGDSLKITYAPASQPLPKAVGSASGTGTYELTRDATAK